MEESARLVHWVQVTLTPDRYITTDPASILRYEVKITTNVDGKKYGRCRIVHIDDLQSVFEKLMHIAREEILSCIEQRKEE